MKRVIDAHHHLWKFNEREYGWIGADMSSIRRDFSVCDLESELSVAGVDGTVAVQARQTLAETDFLLEIAENSNRVTGVVGWFPLRSPSVEEEISNRRAAVERTQLVGARHVVQDEPDPGFILDESFNRGISVLSTFDLVYDILVVEDQLPQAIEFVDRHPNQRFVLDHAAKPRIKERVLEPWRTKLQELAKRENVFCKVSGLITEADKTTWDIESLRPYLDHIFESFGPTRLMFGSDWPVCLTAGSYRQWLESVKDYSDELTESERDALFGGTAQAVYGVSVS
ncbi:MAG: amidohydrolase family protein [Spirochaetaceae bacterium]